MYIPESPKWTLYRLYSPFWDIEPLFWAPLEVQVIIGNRKAGFGFFRYLMFGHLDPQGIYIVEVSSPCTHVLYVL